MKTIKNILKFHVLPKKLYLKYSATRKYARSHKKGERELRLLPFLVDPDKSSIDIGANTGLYTYFLSTLSKNVYAFEPHKNLADFLKKASGQNVRVEEYAVSDQCEDKTFYTPLINGKESLNIASLDQDTLTGFQCQKKIMKTTTLDTYGLKDVGFIKIDVEGHELSVLHGAIKTIEHCRPIILIEILPKPDGSISPETRHFMENLQYEMLYLENNLLTLFSESNKKHDNRNFIFVPKDTSIHEHSSVRHAQSK